MRFKSNVKDVGALLGPLQALSCCGKYCLVVLSRETVRFMLTPELCQTSGEQVYTEIPTETVFENFQIDSLNHDTIVFLLYIPSFIKLLKSGEKAESVLLRLSKRDKRAFLTSEIFINDQKVLQDLPIQLHAQRTIDACEEPMLDSPKVKVQMPNMKSLATLIEKLKLICDTLEIQMTTDGKLTFSSKDTLVEIHSTYGNLKVQSETGTTPLVTSIESPAQPQLAQNIIANELANAQANAGAAGGDGVIPSPVVGVGPPISPSAFGSAVDASGSVQPVEVVNCAVNIKKFANIMAVKNLQAASTLGCIVEGAAFVFHMKLKSRRGTMTYYLPLLSTE